MKKPDLEHIGAIAEREFKEFRISKRRLKKVEAIEMVRQALGRRQTKPRLLLKAVHLVRSADS